MQPKACLVPLLLGKTIAFVHWLPMDQLRGEHSACCQFWNDTWDMKNGVTRQSLSVRKEHTFSSTEYHACFNFHKTNILRMVVWRGNSCCLHERLLLPVSLHTRIYICMCTCNFAKAFPLMKIKVHSTATRLSLNMLPNNSSVTNRLLPPKVSMYVC